MKKCHQSWSNINQHSSDLYMSIISRERNDFLLQFLSYERETLWDEITLKSLFLQSVLRKQHWIQALLDAASSEKSFNAILNQHIELFKVIAFCSKNCDNAELWLDYVPKVLQSTNFNGVCSDSLRMCHLELQRQTFLLEFLRDNSSFQKIGDSCAKFSILESLLDYVDFNSNNYVKIEQLIEQNHQLKLQQLSIHQKIEINQICSDSHLLREYLIIKFSLDLIQTENVNPMFEQKVLNSIKVLFRSIEEEEIFVKIAEIVFSLLFLRYEHIRKSKRGSNLESRSMTTSIITSSPSYYSQLSLPIKIDPPQAGFVCSRKTLELLLNLLKSVCVQRKHSKPDQNCNDSIKLRFKRINDSVTEGLWRLSLLEEKMEMNAKGGIFTAYNYHLALKFHKTLSDGENSSERTSEEDKLKHKVKKPFKRKLRKRSQPKTWSDGNERSSMSLQTSNTDVSGNAGDSGDDASRTTNIICRMLMNPPSLVTISMDNQQTVQQILEVSSFILLIIS